MQSVTFEEVKLLSEEQCASLSLLLEHVWEDGCDSYVASVLFSEFSYSLSHHGYESLVDQCMNYFDVEKLAYISLASTKRST